MNKRIKTLRKELELTQSQFAENLNITKSAIANMETGARNITDRTISDICSKFNVNEEWLRTGKGEIFIQNDNTIVSRLADEYGLDALDRKIIESYLRLGEFQRKVIKDYIVSLSANITPVDDGETVIIAAKDEGLKVISKDKAKRDLYSEK